MIGVELRITLLIVVILFIIFILNKLKNKTLFTKYALLWIVSSLAMLLAVTFPGLLEGLSSLLGFEKTSNMIFLIGFFIILCIVFGLTLIVSKQKKEIIALIQQVSILSYRLDNENEKK